MRNTINISGYGQVFPYLIEYSKGEIGNKTKNHNIKYYKSDEDNTIRLFDSNIVKYYRNTNEWYSTDNLFMYNTYLIPEEINTTKIRVYIPTHTPSNYTNGIQYMLSLHTWINGVKIDFGSYLIKPSDVNAIPTGIIKNGNNEYLECIDFDIIDPFYIMYSDDWLLFRNNICGEKPNLNNTGSPLQVSLFVVDDFEVLHMINSNLEGGCINFQIAESKDYLTLNLKHIMDPSLGFRFEVNMNPEYNWLLDYLFETYGIEIGKGNIKFNIVIKNENSIVIGPTIWYNAIETYGLTTQEIYWNELNEGDGLKLFFSSWDAFEEGWNLVASLVIVEKFINNDGVEEEYELFSIVSNEIPITQELFSKFVNGGSEKIIDIEKDMNIIQYSVVNKIENKIVQLERPNESKANILQPVFFRSKETEVLTIYPAVTENISINLDNYKSKVDTFILQIAGNNFNQIGANSYGIIFQIPANSIPTTASTGTYYILNENLELITLGKYTCVR